MFHKLTLFPNGYKKSSKQPDYIVQASEKMSDGTWENFKVGSAWIRNLRNGTQVVDIALNSEPFTKDNGDVIPAYCVVETNGTKQKLNPGSSSSVQTLSPVSSQDDDIPTINLDDEAEEESIVIDDIPF